MHKLQTAHYMLDALGNTHGAREIGRWQETKISSLLRRRQTSLLWLLVYETCTILAIRLAAAKGLMTSIPSFMG